VRTAQVLLLIVRQALSWAEKRQPWRPLLIAGNPADLITEDSITPPDYKSERERVLSPAEIQELAQVLTKPDPRPLKEQTQCALWILLGTICRVGELLHARWEDVDLKAGVWFIPEENVKGRRGQRQAQKVALSPFVLRHFRQLHALTGAGPWCFPASTPGTSAEVAGPVGINTISKQIADRQAMFSARAVALQHRRNDNTLVLAGGKNGKWTPHDLRRTGATMMQALGVGLEIIDRCQNHVLAGSKVRRHYLHYDYAEEKARAWNLLGERLEGILSGGAEILPIKRRA
jgi:integrase